MKNSNNPNGNRTRDLKVCSANVTTANLKVRKRLGYLTETGCEDVRWVQMAQDRVQSWALVNMLIKLHAPKKVGNL
jgi:hypothetical protein